MRRPMFRRTPSSRFAAPEYRVPIPQSPTQMSLRNRDTGFPEPFCGNRNTSLPHPEAKFGPDACISEEDVNPTRALLRYRMSFTAQRELRGRSSALHDRTPSSSSDEGALSALGRLAASSLRLAELPKLSEGLDASLSSKDTDSIASFDGVIGRSPSSMQNAREFDQPKAERQDWVRDHRDGQPSGSLVKRLMHR